MSPNLRGLRFHPVSGGPEWRGNEPASTTLIDDEAWSSIPGGWFHDGGFTIDSDSGAPESPSGILRALYPTGFTSGGSSPGNLELSFSGYRYFYITFWVKLSSSFYGHSTGINKVVYAWANGNAIFYFEFNGSTTDPLVTKVVMQGTPDDAVLDANLDDVVISRNVWTMIEVLLTGNTSGASNGGADWWVDGVHAGGYTGRTWTATATSWDIFNVRPIWGGVGGPTVPADMTMDFDHLYLSGKN